MKKRYFSTFFFYVDNKREFFKTSDNKLSLLTLRLSFFINYQFFRAILKFYKNQKHLIINKIIRQTFVSYL